jgi:hypothetical protein
VNPSVAGRVWVGALVGMAVGAVPGLVLGGIFYMGWVVCAATGSSCGSETHASLRTLGVIAIGAATGAVLGAIVARLLNRARPG